MSNHAFKADAVLQAIRDADVGDDVVIHNEHGMVWCIVRVMSKEHLEEHNEIKGGGKSDYGNR
jgi:thiamine monophosphate kinase